MIGTRTSGINPWPSEIASRAAPPHDGQWGRSAGPEREGMARLMHQHADAVDRLCPARRRGLQQRGAHGRVDQVDDRLTGVQRVRRHRRGAPDSSPRAPMPTGVALTTMSAVATSSRPPTRAIVGASAVAASARATVRFTTTTDWAPAPARANTTARAAPPAPSTTAVRPAGSTPASSRRLSMNPATVGVVGDQAVGRTRPGSSPRPTRPPWCRCGRPRPGRRPCAAS